MSQPKQYGIIVVGATKEGKTTLVCTMAGMGLKAYRNEHGKIHVKKKDEDQQFCEPIIGCTIKSQTSVPFQQLVNDNTSLWDCPGFSDS